MTPAAEIATQFRDLFDPGSVDTGDALKAFTVDGLSPACVLLPQSVDELSRCATAADRMGWSIIPAGNGTQLGIGRVPQRYDVAVSTQRLRRVLAHEPADMTVTVEAGLTLAELNATLAATGQRLPLDPPYPQRTTIGALIATDASGPLRLSQGKVRDLLIGITVVLADGNVVKGGGRVVKNVAGYDLMKLFTGSFGTLGIIAEATFKIRPCPEHEAVFVVGVASITDAVACALAALSAPLAPLYVEALNAAAARRVGAGVEGAAVVVGCGGSTEEIAVQRRRLDELVGRPCAEAAGTALYPQLRDLLASRTDTGVLGCKLSVLPSELGTVLRQVEDDGAARGLPAEVLAHVGSGVATIRWAAAATLNGDLAQFAERVRAGARAAGGWAVFDALPAELKDRIDPWGSDVPGIALMRGIKATLDPRSRLSPGRFVGGM